MPGWMGLRGLKTETPRDMERERREERKKDKNTQVIHRSREKVQEILRDQQGDMSAFQGSIESDDQADCARIWAYPVESIMSAKVAALSFDDNLLTVEGIFSKVKFRHLPIVDEEGHIIGIISDRDFLRVVSPFFGTVNEQNRDKEIMLRKVGTIMTRHPVCAQCHTTILEAVHLMNERKISCLPIVENEQDGNMLLLGIVTWKDVVRAFCPPAFGEDCCHSRLQQGAHVNPATSESARLRARTSESARSVARHSVRDESESMSKRLADRIRGDAGASGEPGGKAEPISLAGTVPQLGGQKKLQPRTAGLAGSNLAARQQELMSREHSESEADGDNDLEFEEE